MVAARSEEGRVEVNDAARSEGGGFEVDGGSATMTKSLRKRTATARSEGRAKAMTCSKDEGEACSGVRIVDDRWHDGF
jgi:hypothetical protein